MNKMYWLSTLWVCTLLFAIEWLAAIFFKYSPGLYPSLATAIVDSLPIVAIIVLCFARPRNTDLFDGRIGRLQFILFYLAISIVGGISFGLFLALGWVTTAKAYNAEVGWYVVLVIITSIAFASAVVRRFHDLGKSGTWWFGLYLIPLYNLYLLLQLLFQPGSSKPNQYGEPI
jgi:uncharacterized membrane protein YhaH (DUF805 family)